jgi:acyl carrier protein
LLNRAGFPVETGDPGLALVRALLGAGLRTDALVGSGEGIYLAVAAAGGLDEETAQSCVEFHRDGLLAGAADPMVPEARADRLYKALAASAMAPLEFNVLLQRTGVMLPAGMQPSIDDLVEESMASFEGFQPEEHLGFDDVTAALEGWSSLLRLLARAWEQGVDIPWAKVAPRTRRTVLPLALAADSHWSLAPAGAEVRASSETFVELPDHADSGDHTEPEEVMTALAAIWSEVLGVVPESEDSFFALGGHSIHAAQMLARILERLDVRCTLGELLEAETLSGMGELVTRQRRIDSLVASVAGQEQRPGDEVFEL